MYKLILKGLTALISIVYMSEFIDYNNTAFAVLMALAVSFIMDIKTEKLAAIACFSFFIGSFFYHPLIFTYPIVIPSFINFSKIKYLLLSLAILTFFIVKEFDPMLILLSILVYFSAIFEEKYSEYREKIYEKDDDFKLQLKEREKVELRLEGERAKDIEIAILSERNRISREIHDSVGHTISGAIIQTEAMRTNDDNVLNKQIDALQKNLKNGMADIRTSLHSLHDKSINLELSINEIIRANSAIKIDLNYQISSEFKYQVKIKILSIIKEVLANSLKHSTADFIKISMIEMPKHLSIHIEDNAFEMKKKGDKITRGLGFISFEEFAKAYNGRFSYDFENGLKLMFLLDKTRLIEEK